MYFSRSDESRSVQSNYRKKNRKEDFAQSAAQREESLMRVRVLIASTTSSSATNKSPMQRHALYIDAVVAHVMQLWANVNLSSESGCRFDHWSGSELRSPSARVACTGASTLTTASVYSPIVVTPDSNWWTMIGRLN